MQVEYLLKCVCKWWTKRKGTSESFKDLVEFKPCVTCHGPKKFKCPKCARVVKAVRVESPDPPDIVATSVPAVEIPSFISITGVPSQITLHADIPSQISITWDKPIAIPLSQDDLQLLVDADIQKLLKGV